MRQRIKVNTRTVVQLFRIPRGRHLEPKNLTRFKVRDSWTCRETPGNGARIDTDAITRMNVCVNRLHRKKKRTGERASNTTQRFSGCCGAGRSITLDVTRRRRFAVALFLRVRASLSGFALPGLRKENLELLSFDTLDECWVGKRA